MQSTTMILTTLLAAGALASPFHPGRQQMCNKAPTGSASGNHSPFQELFAPTADSCRRECEANPDCQSFVFGLAPFAADPKCLLFTVPGWQVPSQGDELNVFDRSCSDVPTAKPTHHQHEPSRGEQAPPVFNPAHQQPDHSASPVFNPAHQQPTHSASPVFNPAHQQPTHSASPVVNPAHQQPGQSVPSAQSAAPAKPAQTANAAPSPPKVEHHQRQVAHKCGAAPTGPTGNTPAPLRTDPSVESEKACLDLCKKTPGCKSAEFGRPSPQEASECRLFEVEAARLPAPGDGQSFNAFDGSC